MKRETGRTTWKISWSVNNQSYSITVEDITQPEARRILMENMNKYPVGACDWGQYGPLDKNFRHKRVGK